MAINNSEDLNKYYSLINNLVDNYVESNKIKPSNLLNYLKPGSDRFNRFLTRNGLNEVKGSEIILRDILVDRAGMEEDGVYTFETYKYYESNEFKLKSMRVCLYKGIDKSTIKEEKVIADYFDINLGDIDVKDAEKHMFKISDWHNDNWEVIIYSKEDIDVIKNNFVDFTYEEVNNSKITVADKIVVEIKDLLDKQSTTEKISKSFNDGVVLEQITEALGDGYRLLDKVGEYYLWSK